MGVHGEAAGATGRSDEAEGPVGAEEAVDPRALRCSNFCI
jgi:hypothetical protein